MEFKTDGLLLRAADYGENDRMVTLLTAERGKVSAAMKGVRKAGAKLRFASQPFCFAEYVLAEKSGRRTVISASLHDGFFGLREDIGAFYAASSLCEICDKILFEEIESGELLVSAAGSLRRMCDASPVFALLGFFLCALKAAGYPVRAAETCPVCGKRLAGRMRFDMESGSFCCDGCGKGVPASEVTYLAIRRGLGERAEGDLLDGEKRALRLLNSYFTYQTDSELSTLPEYVRML